MAYLKSACGGQLPGPVHIDLSRTTRLSPSSSAWAMIEESRPCRCVENPLRPLQRRGRLRDAARRSGGGGAAKGHAPVPKACRIIPCTSGQPNCYCRSGRTRAIARYDGATGEELAVYCGAA